MHCTRASRPVYAVVVGGQETVRSGSTTATSGTRWGERIDTFWSPAPKTAFFVTSLHAAAVSLWREGGAHSIPSRQEASATHLPTPAVVGHAM